METREPESKTTEKSTIPAKNAGKVVVVVVVGVVTHPKLKDQIDQLACILPMRSMKAITLHRNLG